MFVSDESFKFFKYIYRGGGANGPPQNIYFFFLIMTNDFYTMHTFFFFPPISNLVNTHAQITTPVIERHGTQTQT
jgi:hypothetical protein